MQHQKKDSRNGHLNGEGKSNGHSSFSENEESPQKKPNISPVNLEVIRLIGQHLSNLGLQRSAEMLMEEAACSLDHPAAARFRTHVLIGEWNKAEADLSDLQDIVDESSLSDMRFLIVEQKYLEFLEKGAAMEALTCLRSQVTPFAKEMSRVHELSGLMFISDPEELRKAARWKGTSAESRQELMTKLQKYLPPTVMLPTSRLEKLIMQAVQYQRSQCPYHNTRDDTQIFASIESLLTDHSCSRQIFTTYQRLTDHSDEVWIARFSPDGMKLATGSKDSTLIVWDVDPKSLTVTKKSVYESTNFGMVYLSWSPDSTKLLICLHDDASELLVYDAVNGNILSKVSNSSEDSLTCATWHKDSKRFACGGIKGQFYLCDLDGHIIETWEGVRVQCLAYLPDGKTVLASDTHHRIRGYQLEDANDFNVLQEDQSIMTFNVDRTGRYALLNVAAQGVHLWDLQTKTLVRKFRGLTQGHYTIHSCFGGENEDFVASGSEDHKVYIWHRSRETPVAALSGHSNTVSCVTWNPVFHHMLASVSDDGTVRVWGPEDTTKSQSNGSQSVENGANELYS